MDNKYFSELNPSVVLGVAAHPDDLDFMCAGSIAKFVESGADAYYLVLTDGCKGSENRLIKPAKLKEIRRKEQIDAGKVIGLKNIFFCDFVDGELENKISVKKEIVRVIRMTKPDVIITFDPSLLYSAKNGFVNHPDHRAAAQATLDAAFPLARDHLTFPELGYEPHKTRTLLLANLDKSNFAIDVSETLEKKFEALAKHTSQISDIESVKERFTKRAKDSASKYGYNYAESFMRIDLPV